ncbi:serine/threonine-protein kinase Chk1-like [Oratosquilla oratoria]|uniref:serine/threonine-protein kinase Chk1-like n=1 Tax=Oratosquilla oratoria TaxID=337810 RepID=UPI003F76EFD3
MFSCSCLGRSKSRGSSSDDNAGQRLGKESKSPKKNILDRLTQCGAFIKRILCKSKQKSSVCKTPTKAILKANEEQLRVFEEANKWTRVRVLGEGTFGQVFLIKNKESLELVAKKVIPFKKNMDYTIEAVIQFQLKHPNVTDLFCWEQLENELHLYMEYCSGGDIKRNLDRMRHTDAFYFFYQMMEGVEYLHRRGVAHRDLKPKNLLLTEDKVLKIADFGLARVFLIKGKEIKLRGRVGTRHYMAPEVIRCRMSKYLGPPVDLWSCGVILVKLLTKTLPWDEAVSQDTNYCMWVEKDEELNQLMPFCWLNKTFRPLVDLLLEPDPLVRLSGWRKHRQS